MQSLLADWLRMENVVVLTAAGCSVKAGGRIMAGPAANNLECLVIDAVKNCPLSSGAKGIIDWKTKNGFGNGGFENWLSYLFSNSDFSSDPSSPIETINWKSCGLIPDSEIAILKRYLERAIFAECALTLPPFGEAENEKITGHIPFLAKLIARDANLGRTHLFTLNYDTLFEQAMDQLGIQYFDGFSGSAKPKFDPSVYGLDIYYPGDVAEGRVRRFDNFLQFYKLHGSIHWYQDKDGTFSCRHEDLSFAEKYRSSDVSNKSNLLQSERYKEIKSFGILPTSQKFSQTLGIPYAHLFRLFHSRLNQPQTFLIVAGYGFGDDHVTRIIETALTNPSLVMLVIEPDPNGSIVKKIASYQSLGQRAFVLTTNLAEGASCTYEFATFDDFAINVMPDVQWLEDFKNLRKFERQLERDQEHLNGGGEV
ncbi:SIR2 family protein [Roseibium alexandrii]|uniref:SIR2 family protein n=1 Tax=Roseibium alexandrii TaxID=388408 RepID=UPI0037508AE8